MKKKNKKERNSFFPTLIAGLTATAIGFATYTMIKGDKPPKRVERYDSKKKEERLFI
ncbi:hypothetical protein [Reichenbachiella ulvae]|uniref:YtxH-like protein n=1 Tax=Reichenbachiella ulvae TaxID=2980104 RepID=A0ABT3D058_9BACT|nr:hypothetical protein [Reichenbachiella ulvae]MCV9389330.1 hypothetical protein [Reichenbachiella ulvae]